MRCVIDDGCRGPVPAASRIALCELHLAIAVEESDARGGITDVLPGVCLACGSRMGVRLPSGWVCAVCEWRFGETPDADLAPPRVDVVYYLGFRDRVKIGTTGNPRQRFAAILHDEVLAFERGDRMREHARHEQFAAERLERSEWFERSPRLDAHIAALAGGADPWVLLARWRSEAVALRG